MEKSRFIHLLYIDWQGMNDGVETFIATRRGGATKAVWLDMASSTTLDIMADYKDAVYDARGSEWIMEGSLCAGLLAIMFPDGRLAKEITKEVLKALGLGAGEIAAANHLHSCYVKADTAFLKL